MFLIVIGLCCLILLFVALVYCLGQAATVFPGIPAPIRNIAIVIIFLVLFYIALTYLGISPSLAGLK